MPAKKKVVKKETKAKAQPTKMELYIKEHEGFNPRPYKDSKGILTIGYGHNLSYGLPKQILEQLFRVDLLNAVKAAVACVPSFKSLSANRQMVLVDMAFHMGVGGLSSFRKMRNCIAAGEFADAATEIRNSQYGRNFGKRAGENADLMRKG